MLSAYKDGGLREVTATLSADATAFPHTISGKLPKIRPFDPRLAIAHCQKNNVSELVGRLLAIREIPLEGANAFLKPSIKESMPDPNHLLDMEKAAQRLAQSVMQQGNVTIFGDYDVDGSTATALMIRFLRNVGLKADYYIPDRISEGYGPTANAMQKIAARGTSLVITVDCGTVAHEAIDAANAAGMDVLVVDHHLSAGDLPKALAIVNPNRLDETSKYKNLCAAGVAFLLAISTQRELRLAGWFENGRSEANLMELLDLVALGTVCDVMTLNLLNRAYVTQGLRILNYERNVGLKALMDVAQAKRPATTYTLGFVLGPRINAGGRIGASDLGVRLMTTEDPDEAWKIAQELNKLNLERQAIEALALDQALISAALLPTENPLLFIADTDANASWHQGIIGIVAGRLKDKFDKPTAILSYDAEKNHYKASCRSVYGVDFGTALANAKAAGLLVTGGGHAMAAGFTVAADKKNALSTFLKDAFAQDYATYKLQSGISIDAVLTPRSLNDSLAKELEQLEPYGMGNAEPRILLENAKITFVDALKGGHLRVTIGEANATDNSIIRVKAMAFRAENTQLGDMLMLARGKLVRLIGRAKQNHYQGVTSHDFHIEDMIA